MTKAQKIALVALCSFAGLIRFYKLGEKQLWLDEIIQILHSTPSNIRELLTAVTEDRGGVPLDYLLQHFVISLLGTTEFTARLHAAIFGTLTIVVLYSLVKRLFEHDVAFLATLLFAVYPLHHHYSQEGRPYALFTFLTVCSFISFLNVLQKSGKQYWLIYILNLTVLLYANYFGIFVIFSQLAFALTLIFPKVRESFSVRQRVDARLLAKLGLASATAFAFLIPWIFFGIKTVYGYEPAPDVFGVKLISRIIRELGDQSTLLGGIVVALAVIGIVQLARSRRYGHLSFLLCWAVLSLPFILLLLWIKEYFFVGRQLLFMTPALFVLVAVGISYLAESIKPRYKFLATAAVTVVLVVVSLSVIWNHIPEKSVDFKAAGQFLSQNVKAGDIVIAPKIEGVLIYYFPEMPQHTISEAALNSDEIISAGRRVFIVECTYMTEADRERMAAFKQRLADLVSQPTDFREIKITEMKGR